MCSDDGTPTAASSSSSSSSSAPRIIPITRGEPSKQSPSSNGGSGNGSGGASADAKEKEAELQQIHEQSQSDLWSLGVVLYAMAFSHLPWTSTRAEDLLREITSKPLEVPAVPKRSNELIQLMTQVLLPH